MGPGEKELSLSRVMRNFGRSLLAADRATRNGLADPASVSQEDLRSAVEGLSMAMSCAEAVLLDGAGALHPRKAARLSGEEKERYLELYAQRMEEFHEALRAYRATFQAFLASPGSERNFAAAREQSRAVMAAANRAHEDMQ